MAIIKCKMCGGDLEIVAENRVAVCEYCGTQQTVPGADNEKKLTLFGRANRLRMACEFDKAAGVYESIVVDFPEEAEAYWGLVLCKYGIEYVDDPATGKKIPTCHRSSFDSVMDDSNLEQALENADVIAQKVYREEAKQFERIRKGILEVSSSEKPYDIFICYKETDEKGDRTLDSVLAQDLYAALTDKGYRVFFSRITLQGKLGEAYEPYIFAALNSAKVMLAVGTCYEYYNAVWVKNEWSRYIKLCEADKSKHLIPCYKNLDPEDMPKEFKHLQGADLGKMGAVQDILFNMEKYIPLKKETVKETVVVQQSAETTKVQTLLERALLFLEDGDWNAANEYCEKALDIDPKCAEGYLGKLMIDLKIRRRDELKDCAKPFAENSNYQKTVRFADDKLRNILAGYLDTVTTRIENAKKDEILAAAEQKMTGVYISNYRQALELLESIPGWKDADEKALACQKIIKEAEKKQELARQKEQEKSKKSKKVLMIVAPIVCVAVTIALVLTQVIIPGNKYDDAIALLESGNIVSAYEALVALDGYKDSDDKANSIYDKYKKEKLTSAVIGDYVFFGACEQDNNTSNGKEDIEWIVLEVKDGKALVISRYALDFKLYDENSTYVTWETCTLRKWLNNDFINSAFLPVEMEMIPTVTVSADRNPDYKTDPGNATQDQMFLLSITEINKYFSSDSARQCKPTKHAVANGAYADSDTGSCGWWLRSPGAKANAAVDVAADGSVDAFGSGAAHRGRAVRPAMWIDLSA